LVVVLLALAAALPARAQSWGMGPASESRPATEAGAQAPAVAPDVTRVVTPAATQPGAEPREARPDRDPAERPELSEPGTGASLVGALVRMLVVLALVIALIYLTLNFGLRRLMQLPQSRSVVTVHERAPLEPKKSVYVVEVAGEFLLLGVGEGEINLLAKLDKERAEQALARKRQASRPAIKPFWERLSFKPSPRKPARGDPS